MRGREEAARPALARGPRWAPVAIVLAVSLYFLDSTVETLRSTVSEPDRVEVFLGADSKHYLEMAEAFAEGELTEKYVRVRPHRQPLYPAVLAIAVRAGGGRDLFLLGMVNVLIGLGTIWLIFLLVSKLSSSPMIGALSALLYARNDFALDYITDRIMTEPLFALCSFAALALALLFAERGRVWTLYLASFAAGLTYLTRPNGLFLMVALWTVLLASELLSLARDQGWRHPDLERLRGIALRFGVAGLLFVATTVPGWAPRLAFYGDPFYYGGVLTNTMWTDSWEELRAGKDHLLGPSDYFASHGLEDVASRLLFGFQFVYVRAPHELTPKIHLLAAAGLLVALVRRRRRDLILVAIMLITLLPITWTSLSTPFDRIAYGAEIAFILLFSALLLELGRDLCARAIPRFGAGAEPGASGAR
jgi:hypothetical protein